LTEATSTIALSRETLGEYLDFVPVCPEVEAGFPIPRETFRLVGDPENPRFMSTSTLVDHTERMAAWAENASANSRRKICAGSSLRAIPSAAAWTG
jgi:uncharacterized protein YbbK (DUF523 family)